MPRLVNLLLLLLPCSCFAQEWKMKEDEVNRASFFAYSGSYYAPYGFSLGLLHPYRDRLGCFITARVSGFAPGDSEKRRKLGRSGQLADPVIGYDVEYFDQRKSTVSEILLNFSTRLRNTPHFHAYMGIGFGAKTWYQAYQLSNNTGYVSEKLWAEDKPRSDAGLVMECGLAYSGPLHAHLGFTSSFFERQTITFAIGPTFYTLNNLFKGNKKRENESSSPIDVSR